MKQETTSKNNRAKKIVASKKLQLYLYKIEAEYRRRKRASDMVRLYRFLTH